MEITRIIRILLFSPSISLITLEVTEEKMMGIIEMDIKVRNIELKGFKAFPTSGAVKPMKAATIAAPTVDQPLSRKLRILSPNLLLIPRTS
jgi:hypothetical protein